MRNSNTGLSHGTAGSPQESIESLEYGAKVQEIENGLKEEFGRSEYPKEVLSSLGNTEHFTEGVFRKSCRLNENETICSLNRIY